MIGAINNIACLFHAGVMTSGCLHMDVFMGSECWLQRAHHFLVCTAIVTRSIREVVMQNLEMADSEFVCMSPDRPNIFCEVHPHININIDMLSDARSLKDLKLPLLLFTVIH